MTENEAISMLEQGDKNANDADCTYEEYLEAIEMGRKALEEIQQYRAIGLTPLMVKDLMASEKRAHKTALENANMLDEYRAIGTIEEFKALKEKSVAKKPFQPFGTHSYKCSNCWKFVAHEVDDNCDLSSLAEWCPYCGSRIDWSE